MKNKRIAVIFAGQPRTFRHCYKSHLEFFKSEEYDFDFFIHAWSDQWYRTKTCSNYTVDNEFLEDEEQLKKELLEIYQPKAMAVERQKECKKLIGDMEALMLLQKSTNNQCWSNKNQSYTAGRWGKNHGVGRWLDGTHSGQVYSWEQAANLKIDYEKENDLKYDGVIKFRLDNILDMHNEARKKDIFEKACTPRLKFQWQHTQSNGFWTVGDMFFCGQSEQFDILLKDIYTFLIRQYCNILGNIDGHWSHAGPPETILSKKLVHEKIPTHGLNVSQIPYREYHIDLKDQNYRNLKITRQQADEGGVQR